MHIDIMERNTPVCQDTICTCLILCDTMNSMTATGHAIIGTLIAAKIGNPALAIPIAIVSHIAADAFPHWDTGTNKKTKTKLRFFTDSFLDVLLSLLLPYIIIHFFFSKTNLGYTYIIVFFAQLLDWITAPYVFFNMKFPPFSWCYRFQKSFDNKLDKPWGIITQTALLLILIILAKIA